MAKEDNIKNKLSNRDYLAYKKLQLRIKEGYNDYQPILNFIEKHYISDLSRNFELDDFIQECLLKILENKRNGIHMNSATSCHRVYQNLQNQEKMRKQIEASFFDKDTLSYEMSTNFELPQLFQKIFQDLTPQYQTVLFHYFGFPEYDKLNQTEIAQMLQVSRARIQDILQCCYRKFHENMLLIDYDIDASLQNKCFVPRGYQKYIFNSYPKKEYREYLIEQNQKLLFHFFLIRNYPHKLAELTEEKIKRLLEIYELCAWDLPTHFTIIEINEINSDYNLLLKLKEQAYARTFY